ncbi:MAG: putative bifunctional diguanylate cyclase/phosphodiesterase [Novosphingobium sp.]
MQHAARLLRSYEEAGLGWFWSTDAGGRVDYISGSAAAMLGRTAEDIAGQPLLSLFLLEGGAEDRTGRTLPLILNSKKTFSDLAVKADCRDGEMWWAISGRPQFSGTGEFSGYCGNGHDITDLRRSQQDASRLATSDSLTGLSNRHQMESRLETTLAAYRAAKRSCALVMLDLDRFKQVNDTLGHQAGDDLLRQVAQRMRDVLEANAFNCELGRLGGDEFQIMLPDIDDRGRLGELGKAIIAVLSQPFAVVGGRCSVGTSLGIAIAPFDGEAAEELVRSADLALYAAKAGGRGQFRFYSNDLQAQAERRQQIEADLRDALANRQIWLAYQPQVDTAANKVVALEAEMRWTHPELGEVPPSLFMPLAEERKLIGPLSDWAIMTACEDAAQWPGSVRVAVNVTVSQSGNLGFSATVAQALTNSGLAPERLELEIGEGALLEGDEHAAHLFDSLKVLGVRFSLDHFGEGHSALGVLRKSTFDKIKIDQSFVRGVTDKGSRNAEIVRSVVSLAKALGMEVAAEGVEAHDELDTMRQLGVSHVQGHIYGDALKGEDVSEAMLSGEWVIEPSGPAHYRPDRKTVFRKIGLIHENHRYEATMRNVSRSGCMIEGLLEVPADTQFVVDFGEGQLAVGVVRRSAGAMMGLEFEQALVDDGAGGLCTRHRVSPLVVASATAGLPANSNGSLSLPKFAQTSGTSRKGPGKEE